jgi:lactoylglutathione lyase
LGLQQIAVGSTSRDELLHLWVDILGLEPMGTYVSEKENVDEVILTVGLDDSPRHSVEIDLMVPLDANKSPKVCILFFYVVKSHFNSGERF